MPSLWGYTDSPGTVSRPAIPQKAKSRPSLVSHAKQPRDLPLEGPQNTGFSIFTFSSDSGTCPVLRLTLTQPKGCSSFRQSLHYPKAPQPALTPSHLQKAGSGPLSLPHPQALIFLKSSSSDLMPHFRSSPLPRLLPQLPLGKVELIFFHTLIITILCF